MQRMTMVFEEQAKRAAKTLDKLMEDTLENYKVEPHRDALDSYAFACPVVQIEEAPKISKEARIAALKRSNVVKWWPEMVCVCFGPPRHDCPKHARNARTGNLMVED